MVQGAFLLNPNYAEPLASDTLRERFREESGLQNMEEFPLALFALWQVGGALFPLLAVLLVGSVGGLSGWGCVAISGSFALLWLGVFTGMEIIALRRRNRLRRLDGESHLVLGEIVTCTGETFSSEDVREHFSVEVTYRARTPAGRDVFGKSSRIRDDLTDKPLPAAGTPVFVLVCDEHVHELL